MNTALTIEDTLLEVMHGMAEGRRFARVQHNLKMAGLQASEKALRDQNAELTTQLAEANTQLEEQDSEIKELERLNLLQAERIEDFQKAAALLAPATGQAPLSPH